MTVYLAFGNQTYRNGQKKIESYKIVMGLISACSECSIKYGIQWQVQII